MVNLRQAPFMDSTGINLLITAQQALTQASSWLRLAGVQDTVIRTLRLVQFDTVINCYPTLRQASAPDTSNSAASAIRQSQRSKSLQIRVGTRRARVLSGAVAMYGQIPVNETADRTAVHLAGDVCGAFLRLSRQSPHLDRRPSLPCPCGRDIRRRREATPVASSWARSRMTAGR